MGRANVAGKHYSFYQVSQICGYLDIDANESKIRTHAIKTGLAKRLNVNVSVSAGQLKYLVAERDVPILIRDITGIEIDLGQIQGVAPRVGPETRRF